VLAMRAVALLLLAAGAGAQTAAPATYPWAPTYTFSTEVAAGKGWADAALTAYRSFVKWALCASPIATYWAASPTAAFVFDSLSRIFLFSQYPLECEPAPPPSACGEGSEVLILGMGLDDPTGQDSGLYSRYDCSNSTCVGDLFVAPSEGLSVFIKELGCNMPTKTSACTSVECKPEAFPWLTIDIKAPSCSKREGWSIETASMGRVDVEDFLYDNKIKPPEYFSNLLSEYETACEFGVTRGLLRFMNVLFTRWGIGYGGYGNTFYPGDIYDKDKCNMNCCEAPYYKEKNVDYCKDPE
jgi:hypothetical protein